LLWFWRWCMMNYLPGLVNHPDISLSRS
jgi:hypothetical protein